MAKAWTKFPYTNKKYSYTEASLKKAWGRLHKGDVEPFPKDANVIAAWIAYHAGDYQKAAELGSRLGDAGTTVINKATAIYATYLEENEKNKMALFQEVAHRAQAQQEKEPKNPNAYYWQAYALGRWAQSVSIAKALAQGVGPKVKAALETTLKLAPKHADAHIALGSYHAEVIDKIGAVVGGLTYGANKDIGLKAYQTALKLNPDSAIARIEYANGLVMLEGKKALNEAEALYAEAAQSDPLDATERLDVEQAKAEFEN